MEAIWTSTNGSTMRTSPRRLGSSDLWHETLERGRFVRLAAGGASEDRIGAFGRS